MKVTITYMAQAKKAAGVSSESLEFSESVTVQEVVAGELCKRHKNLASCILKEDATIRDMVLVFQGDKRIEAHASSQLSDGDELTIMTPITGG